MKDIVFTIVTVLLLVLPASARSPRVRPMSDSMAQLLEEAAARSPTVARLLAVIEASDVILQIEFRIDHTVPRATTSLTGSGGDTRYLRTVMSPRVPPRRRMELLGHELQHVVEVASDPTVRDQQAMRDLFESIGWRRGRAGPFETDAALEVERQIRIELRSSSS
jgi:hypothetical protein